MWANYFLFLLKFGTVIFSIGLLVVGILLIARSLKPSTEMEVKVLNDERAGQKTLFRSMVWSKKEHKALKKQAKLKEEQKKHRYFLIEFAGDIKASDSENLKHAIDMVLENAEPGDECLVKIESAGGMVPHYGLAAMELARIRAANIPLTAVVDKVAASGGYMMACVADKIVANPFAILGSIGVVAQIPNFNKVLKKMDVDFEQHTAGEQKRNLTLFGENTEEGRQQFKEELEKTHIFFKNHVHRFRPTLAVETVATGAHFYGVEALENGLIDALGNSSSLVDEMLKTRQVISIGVAGKKGIKGILSKWLGNLVAW